MFQVPHIIMFFGMLIIHLLFMPLMMVARWEDLEFFSLSQVYVGIWMSSLMVILEALMHPLSISGWIIIVALTIGSFLAFRYQFFISDTDYLKEMIPHHSMAILTSQYRIHNPKSSPEVQSLAKTIILTQEKEIHQMKSMLSFV
jgi:hypothetical protein